MYGTIGTFRVKPGKQQDLVNVLSRRSGDIDGFLVAHAHQSDADPQVVTVLVGFTDKDAYHANAQHPDQHASYLEVLELLEQEPSWNDGAIFASFEG